MVRAPCCEKMGLKKGPWTPEEDQILVAYIQRYGHGNWRALPKQAGLLRCGKSCRLRWTNYLRPDIKRGNFSKEEEETIISLHGMLGNRWSAIAAKLPGRTDNEIKNVWHTHLKKRVKSPHLVEERKRKTKTNAKIKSESKSVASEFNSADTYPRLESQNMAAVSPTQSCSDTCSSSTTDSSLVTGENSNAAINNEWMNSSLEFPEIEESFWTEALGMDDSILPMDSTTTAGTFSGPLIESSHSFSSSNDEDKDFWLRVFMEAGSLQDLPEI